MAAQLSVENLNEKLVCAVCQNTLKNPKLLACFHAFCEECLKQGDQIEVCSGELQCPECSKVTDLPEEGVAGLDWNPLVCRLVEVLQAKKKASHIMCDACGDSESPLTTYCRDCLSFICDACASYHGKMKLLLKDHHTVPLDKIINGTIQIKWMEEGLWRKAHECGDHIGELRRFYCRTCKKRICRDCIVLDHTKPDHDCTTVQKMFQETQEKLKDRLKSCNEKEEHVSTMLNDVDVRETEANREFHMMKQSIRDLKSTAIANMNKTEQELLQKVEVLEEKLNNKIQAFRDNMKTTKENLTKAQSKAKEVVSAKEVTDISRGPFLPEDILKELEELIASDVTMTISRDLMTLKSTMIEGSKLPEQMVRFAKLTLPHIWRETQMFPIPDEDIVNIFCDENSMYVACKKGIYKKLLSNNANPSTWMKLHHNACIKQVVDMAISMKDQTFSFIAETEAACTQLFRLKLDDFPTYQGHAAPSSSVPTVAPCPLNASARITVDSRSRIIVADYNPSKTTDPAPASFGSKPGQPNAAMPSFRGSFGLTFGQPSAAPLCFKPPQASATTASVPGLFGSLPRQSSAAMAPVPGSFGLTFGQPSAAPLCFKPPQASATTASVPGSFGSQPRQSSAAMAPVPGSFGLTFGQPSAAPLCFKPPQASATTASVPGSFGSQPRQSSAAMVSVLGSFGSKPRQSSTAMAPVPGSFGSKPRQSNAAMAPVPGSFGSKPRQSSATTASVPGSFGSKPRQSSAATAPVPGSFGFTFGQPSVASLCFKPPQASATTEPTPASFGFKPDQIPKRPPPGRFSFDMMLPQQQKVTSICSSQTASAGTGNAENKPSSTASNGKEGKPELGLPITRMSTTIYRGKPGKISSPSMQCGSVLGLGSSQLSLDNFEVPLDRIRSLAAAKSGQLVFLRWDKKAVIITDKYGRIQHEIKEPGRMYLSISCTESDALYVLSAFWGSHIVTLTKHSLQDGGLLEHIIDELDVSANFQSDEWPVIGNNGNDLVVINVGDEIRVYAAEEWD
ncbi:uncharacterized protein LOC105444110 [Strongylocentrotus purpuratus]|uniref:Uncharacterized protein n=1 Tax=Strongylocentrotus purpuratus TaxID=7668 RepID=A0A7M7HPX0_STRPU|nr:uncharacterized protein LOC105444110 [Strongylocentrotus purpuratus]